MCYDKISQIVACLNYLFCEDHFIKRHIYDILKSNIIFYWVIKLNCIKPYIIMKISKFTSAFIAY